MKLSVQLLLLLLLLLKHIPLGHFALRNHTTSLPADNLRVYYKFIFVYIQHNLYVVTVVLKETSPVLEVALKTATAAGVSCSSEMVLVVNPKRIVAAVVALTGPTSWSRIVLEPTSVGPIDDRFINRGVTTATVLSICGIFVPGMGLVNDGLPILQISGLAAPKIASSKYATRDPAVRPIL
jgi:hypothetical protein